MAAALRTGVARACLPGLGAFCAAVALAAVFHALYAVLGEGLGKSVSRGVFVLAILVPPAIYVLRAGRATRPGRVGGLLLASATTVLVASYLFGISFCLFYPADFLMWSETDFVNDILKFRVGYPIFSAQVNNESYTYPPGSQLLTYLLASLVGGSTSLPVFRCLQILYTLGTALVAAYGVRGLLEIAGDGAATASPRRGTTLQEIASFGVLFLVATNGLTNPFIHNLHNDALAQLVWIAGYVSLIEYARTGSRRVFVALIFVPAVGFLVKQNLALFGGYACLYLLVFDRPRSLRRFFVYAASGFALLILTVGACYAIWGNDFFYWIFYVLSKHRVVPVRSLQHLVDVRPYLVVGIAGFLAMLRGPRRSTLLGLWSISLLVLLVAAYTGGINFMRHHMGPPSTMAAIWLVAGALRVWPEWGKAELSWENAVRTGLTAAVVALLASGGLGILRTPKPALPRDAWRYLAAVEDEFQGSDPAKVLLDLGSFVYLRTGTVMKDRASPIGERGSSATGDWSGITRRFRDQQYQKILLRNFDRDDFWYDRPDWPKPSGIRALLEERYEVIRRIPAVAHQDVLWSRIPPYGFSEISVLVPRGRAESAANEE